MLTAKFLSVALVLATGAIATNVETDIFALLLKRQEPGTPAYNCHDNCGAAITQSKQPNACTSDAFKTNYNNCLQCAGPDNYNIWKYYGGTLSAAGTKCGLETQPKSGKQPEVGPAVHSGGSSSAATPAASTGLASVTSLQGSAATSAAAATSAVGQTTASSSAAASQLSSSIVATPSRSVNGTASAASSAPAQQSTNAAAHLSGVSGAFGEVFVGAMLGL